MTSPICANFSGNLSGATKQGALTPITVSFVLDGQTGHNQLSAQVEQAETKVLDLPTNLGGPVASPDAQTFLLITCDVANVDISLNSAGVPVGPFNFVKPGGALLVPGQVGGLPVSDVQIVNAGTQRAAVSVTAIFGS